MADETRQITEEQDQDVIKGWYERARAIQNTEELTAFINDLTGKYKHDYGTICHAVAAAALAGAYTVNSHPTQGGITGFQSGAVFWEFAQHWMHINGPAKLMQYEQMLYPQNEESFAPILKPAVMKWLQEEAKKKLEEAPSAHPNVRAHWERIVDGRSPFGYLVK